MSAAFTRVGRRMAQFFYNALTEEVPVQKTDPGYRLATSRDGWPKGKPRRRSLLEEDVEGEAPYTADVDWLEASKLAVGCLILAGRPRHQAQRIAERLTKDNWLQAEVVRLAGPRADAMTIAMTLASAV
ncbi:hypothetical protein [Radicibacter daui]|uniref:hypothetical protein n=1 Tax=Radicibacter daui TaxID=3064829 RepID=UPI004046D5F2